MKTFYFLFFLLFFLSTLSSGQSCGVKSSFTPFGDTTVDVNKEWILNSTSTNATSLEWYVNGLLFSNNSALRLPFTDQFGGAGVYQVQLIASNGSCKDTSQCTVKATGPPPSASSYKLNVGNEYVQIQPITILSTTDAGYVVVGDKVSTGGVDPSKVYVIKFSASGCMQWSRFIYKTNFKKIKQARDGGYLVLGYAGTVYNNTTVLVSYLMKLDKNGVVEWQRSIRGTDFDVVMADFEETDDGYVVAGTVDKFVRLVKLDINRNIVWNKAFSFGSYHQLTGLVYKNNSVIALGYSSEDLLTLKYTSFATKISTTDGSRIWEKNYSYSTSLVFTEVGGSADKMFVTMKGSDGEMMYGIMDTNGTVSNMMQLNAPRALEYSVKPIDDDNLMIFYRYKETLPLQPYYQFHSNVAKVSLSGNVLWAKTFSNYSRDYFSSATVSADKNIEMLGVGYNHLERAYLYYWNMTLVKVANDGTTPQCNFVPTQLSVSGSSISTTNVTSRNDTSLTYVTSPLQTIVERPYTETIFDCPGYYAGCNTIVAGRFDTTCNIKKVHKLRYTKGYGCFTPALLNYNPNDVQILTVSDSVITFKFLRYVSTKLTMTLATPCNNVKDSVMLVAVDKRLNNFSLGDDFGICAGMTKTLSAGSGFTSYKWQDKSPDSIFNVSSPGTYYVTVEDSCGNIYSDTVVAKLTESIPINAGADVSKCNADSINLIAPDGFVDYSWSPNYNIANAQTKTATVFPSKDTAYILTVKNDRGCTGYDTIKVKVNLSSPINLGNDTTLCTSQQILLDAGSNLTSYVWNNGSTASSITVKSAGVYSVKTEDINGCASTDTISVAMQITPVFSLGNDTLICDNKYLVLQANVAGNYLWQNGSIEQQQSVTAAGLYWLEVNNQGCLYRDSINVGIKPSPQLQLGNDTTICEGTNKLLSVDPVYTNVLWQNNSNASSYVVSTPGTYFVKADLNGCTSSDTINILQKLKPRFDLGKDTFLCIGQILPLQVKVDDASLLWSTGSVSSTYTVTAPGIYKVTATNECGSFSDEIVVDIGVCNVEMPTAFTPNNDGLNDQFRIKYPGSIRTIVMHIFNRFGQLVFSTTNAAKGWDGTINGMPQDSGNYIWTINYETVDGAKGSLKGNVLLIR
jgi:gliding motility-associated-like protein